MYYLLALKRVRLNLNQGRNPLIRMQSHPCSLLLLRDIAETTPMSSCHMFLLSTSRTLPLLLSTRRARLPTLPSVELSSPGRGTPRWPLGLLLMERASSSLARPMNEKSPAFPALSTAQLTLSSWSATRTPTTGSFFASALFPP